MLCPQAEWPQRSYLICGMFLRDYKVDSSINSFREGWMEKDSVVCLQPATRRLTLYEVAILPHVAVVVGFRFTTIQIPTPKLFSPEFPLIFP